MARTCHDLLHHDELHPSPRESLIAKCKVGFMERPERIVLFMIGAFTNRMAGVLWVILVLSIFTVADRIIHTYRDCATTTAKRSHDTDDSAPASRAVERVFLDLSSARPGSIRPDGHRDTRIRLADAAGLAGRSDGHGERTGGVDHGNAEC